MTARCCRIFEGSDFTCGSATRSYRQEFAKDDVIVAIDETPIGTFVELEGGEQGIVSAARALGRETVDS